MSDAGTVAGQIVVAGEGDPRRYVGHLFDWKLVGEDTGGAFSLVEIDGWQGGEPPMHYHEREDEVFYVLEGELTFRVGDVTRRGGPGTVVWAPRNVVHGFVFETERVRILAAFLPSGQEDVFHAFSTPDPTRAPAAPPDGAGMPDMDAVTEMDARYGVHYVGPPLRDVLAQES